MDSNNAVIDQLARTKGWTFFMSILLWIGGIFLALVGLGLVGMGVSGQLPSGTEQISSAASGMVAGGFYLFFAALHIYPALKLAKYSKRITQLMASPSEILLADALNEQRAFWKYVAIVTIIVIGLYLLIFIGAALFFMAFTSNVSV